MQNALFLVLFSFDSKQFKRKDKLIFILLCMRNQNKTIRAASHIFITIESQNGGWVFRRRRRIREWELWKGEWNNKNNEPKAIKGAIEIQMNCVEWKFYWDFHQSDFYMCIGCVCVCVGAHSLIVLVMAPYFLFFPFFSLSSCFWFDARQD